ncbi:uncharacterized protein LOC111518361 [Drosophila willistoni]|uniref:uncharacterized protein LOC111518361 n=1 Tax=Drosophila willistoni TaxID=7260 RepID=UPI001F07CA9A|nr:uncharacterized protein LOC111518361 [Drosophila willistoni]
MKCLVIICNFLFGLSTVMGLVHYVKLKPGANGCVAQEGEIKVGETLKDPNVCGVYVCQNKEGDALIHYCQRPATFANCPKTETGVSTVIDFPQCCWICVEYKDCGAGAPSDEGKKDEEKKVEEKKDEEKKEEA